MKCTLIRVDTGLPFVADAVLQSNDDGSVSFALPAGGWAGQEPNVYGMRHDDMSAVPGVYQRFTLDGDKVVSLTRPQDRVFGYLMFTGKAY